MGSSTIAILIAFACYLALMVAIGVICMKKTGSASDYFLGGRGLSGPVAALSAQASTHWVRVRHGSPLVWDLVRSPTG